MNPAAYGRYGDNTMVHMNNDEVAGLASLAKSMGRELTTNPVTGYPEAFSLRDALPTIVGLGAGMMTANPFLIGAAVGGTTAATTGSLEQGLMSGLTAGALSGVGNALAAEGAATTGATVAGPGTMDQATQAMIQQDVGQMAASGMTPQAAAQNIGSSYSSELAQAGLKPEAFMQPTNMQGGLPTITGAAPGSGGEFIPTATPGAPQFTAQAPKAPLMYSPAEGASRLGQQFAGAKSLVSDPSGQRLGQFVSGQKLNLAMAGAGKAGEMQYAAQQEMEDKKEAMDAAKAAKLKATQDSIRQSYANVGRALPMNPYTGRPVFAEGGIVSLMGGGRPFDSAPAQMTPEQAAFLKALMGGSTDIKDLGDKAKAAAGKAAGGYLETGGRVGDGMSDDIPAMIDGDQPAALSDGEFVIPADVVSHLGNGSSDAGAQQLYSMMDRIRQARTGNKEQGKEINAKKYMPA
jgi:hypothetical protein